MIETYASEWPLISVITPSYNQGLFIEQTIESVLLQNYPAFEHIIIDGGSTDETVPILKRHPHLNWVSEKDSGQSEALNKGFKKARGEIIAWINSDDWYEPGSFFVVADFFLRNPNKNVVMGDCLLVDSSGQTMRKVINSERGFKDILRFWVPYSIPTQPAVFFRRSLLSEFGEVDESLYYAMDFDLWLRFGSRYRFHHIDRVVANYRFHASAKGGDQNFEKFIPECTAVFKRYVNKDYKISLEYKMFLLRTFLSKFKQSFLNSG